MSVLSGLVTAVRELAERLEILDEAIDSRTLRVGPVIILTRRGYSHRLHEMMDIGRHQAVPREHVAPVRHLRGM